MKNSFYCCCCWAVAAWLSFSFFSFSACLLFCCSPRFFLLFFFRFGRFCGSELTGSWCRCCIAPSIEKRKTIERSFYFYSVIKNFFLLSLFSKPIFNIILFTLSFYFHFIIAENIFFSVAIVNEQKTQAKNHVS
jgi:hypothetical protein